MDDDEEFFSSPRSNLGSLFQTERNFIENKNKDSLVFTAPKQPRKDAANKQAGSNSSQSSQLQSNLNNEGQPAKPTPSSSTVSTTSVTAFTLVDNKYQPVGKLGFALLLINTAASEQPFDYRLLLYVNKQQHYANIQISPTLQFSVAANNYASILDEKLNKQWMLNFETLPILLDFLKQFLLARAVLSKFAIRLEQDVLPASQSQSQETPSDPEHSVEQGDQVEAKLIATLVRLPEANAPASLGPIFEDNTNEPKPFRFKIGTRKNLQGLVEGVRGMREGGRRLIFVPSADAYRDAEYTGSTGVAIPPGSCVILDVQVVRIRLAGEKKPPMESAASALSSQSQFQAQVQPQAQAQVLPIEVQLTSTSGRSSVNPESEGASTASFATESNDAGSAPAIVKPPRPEKSEHAKLVSRMARIGQPLLPGLAVSPQNPSTARASISTPAESTTEPPAAPVAEKVSEDLNTQIGSSPQTPSHKAGDRTSQQVPSSRETPKTPEADRTRDRFSSGSGSASHVAQLAATIDASIHASQSALSGNGSTATTEHLSIAPISTSGASSNTVAFTIPSSNSSSMSSSTESSSMPAVRPNPPASDASSSALSHIIATSAGSGFTQASYAALQPAPIPSSNLASIVSLSSTHIVSAPNSYPHSAPTPLPSSLLSMHAPTPISSLLPASNPIMSSYPPNSSDTQLAVHSMLVLAEQRQMAAEVKLELGKVLEKLDKVYEKVLLEPPSSANANANANALQSQALLQAMQLQMQMQMQQGLGMPMQSLPVGLGGVGPMSLGYPGPGMGNMSMGFPGSANPNALMMQLGLQSGLPQISHMQARSLALEQLDSISDSSTSLSLTSALAAVRKVLSENERLSKELDQATRKIDDLQRAQRLDIEEKQELRRREQTLRDEMSAVERTLEDVRAQSKSERAARKDAEAKAARLERDLERERSLRDESSASPSPTNLSETRGNKKSPTDEGNRFVSSEFNGEGPLQQ